MVNKVILYHFFYLKEVVTRFIFFKSIIVGTYQVFNDCNVVVKCFDSKLEHLLKKKITL